MAMMTAEQYEESLRGLNLVVYMFGERLENVVDNPIIRPSMQAVAKTYELANRPEYEDIMTVTSHIHGKKINRFTHIHQSIEDLVKKSKMGRLIQLLRLGGLEKPSGRHGPNVPTVDQGDFVAGVNHDPAAPAPAEAFGNRLHGADIFLADICS